VTVKAVILAQYKLSYLLTYFVEGRAKCPTVLQLRELVIGTRVAGQSSE